jgi:hypothetical protein
MRLEPGLKAPTHQNRGWAEQAIEPAVVDDLLQVLSGLQVRVKHSLQPQDQSQWRPQADYPKGHSYRYRKSAHL